MTADRTGTRRTVTAFLLLRFPFDRPPPLRSDRSGLSRCSSRGVTPPWRRRSSPQLSARAPPRTWWIATSWQPGGRWRRKNERRSGDRNHVLGIAALAGRPAEPDAAARGGRAAAPGHRRVGPPPASHPHSGSRSGSGSCLPRTRPSRRCGRRRRRCWEPSQSGLGRRWRARASPAGCRSCACWSSESSAGQSPWTWEVRPIRRRSRPLASTAPTTCVIRRARRGIYPRSSSTPTRSPSTVQALRAADARREIEAVIIRLYFERRRLKVESLEADDWDMPSGFRRDLRIAEVEAELDALTGGAFTRLARRYSAEGQSR